MLTLLHWRQPSRACWIPLLDTKLLPRLASGRKHESYYPIAVADDRFHCIILKGGDQYPYFPRPLLSEFDFSIPLSDPPKPKTIKPHKGGDGDGDAAMRGGENNEENGDDDDDGGEDAEVNGVRKLEQAYLLKGIQASQVRDLAEATSGSHAQRSLLARLEVEIDKTLLQLLAEECRAGEDRGMRALEMVELMRDRTGRMFEAAVKVADRYGRTILGQKIRELGEKRTGGGGDDDEDDDVF